MIKFDAPKDQSSIIKVIGVGGGGSNAVNHMYNQGITGVDFIVVNTDAQALDLSPIPNKIQIGISLTEGMGAGSIPSIGKDAAIESIEEIKLILEKNTKMVFITAGMGGGTGTGGAPVIASLAKEMGILTVAIVTLPFSFEGNKRRLQASEGIRDLRENVDTLLLICNDRLRELYGNLKLTEAFQKADDVLTVAAKGIAEIITVAGKINVDFKDVNTVMKDSGAALMGSGMASGENRARKAIEMALSSPLLNDNNIKGANDILLYIASGNDEINMDEVSEITDFIQYETGSTAEIIWGSGIDESLEDNISITLVATGFKTNDELISDTEGRKREKIIHVLDDIPEEISPKEEVEKFYDDMIIEKNSAVELEIEADESPVEELQDSIAFKIHQPVENTLQESETVSDEPVLIKKSETTTNDKQNEEHFNKFIQDKTKELVNDNDFIQKSKERIQKLKELSINLKTPEGLAEAENKPAYIRRKVELSDTPSSSESEISRYTLTDDDDVNMGIKSNNSYLHDNVD